MDRVRSTLGGAVPPVYLDPLSPSTPPSATFQTDPGQPPTSMTAEHANMLTEEPRNFLIALGGVPDSANDAQLAEMFENTSFAPIVSGVSGGTEIPLTGSDYATQNGYFQRIGNIVIAWFDLIFTNTNAALDAETLLIRPPFRQLSPVRQEVGRCQPNRTAATRRHRSLEFLTISAAPFDSRLIIPEIAGDTGAEVQLTPISNVQRTIRGNIMYWHNGEFLY